MPDGLLDDDPLSDFETRSIQLLDATGRVCVAGPGAKMRAFGAAAASPVADWDRALARHTLRACGGPSVDVIGRRPAGNFALAMRLEAAVLAAARGRLT